MTPSVVTVTIDTDPATPNLQTSTVHCTQCLREKPPEVDPNEYAQLTVGLHADDATVQIWCRRHEINVATFHPSLGIAH
jgi:hypothetical protein